MELVVENFEDGGLVEIFFWDLVGVVSVEILGNNGIVGVDDLV